MKLAAEVVALGAVVAVALVAPGDVWSQEWKLKLGRSADKVQFTIQRSKFGSNWSNSNEVPLANFRGLSSDTFAKGGRAKFEYVHDAGRLICEGSFLWGSGSGTFAFEPDPAFVVALKRLGYEAPDEEQLFAMLVSDVSLEFARGVRKFVPDTSTKQLVELRTHGVTLNYISEVRQAGYETLTAGQYIELRIHGVTSEFMRDLKQAGYDLTASRITELRIHGVNSDYLRDLKSYGLQPSASDLVELRIHGVTPEYLSGLKHAGFGALSSQEITELRIHGVDTDFIQESKTAGYNFTTRELVELRIHGVNGSYLKRLQDAGMKNLTATQIVKLRIHGVD